MSRVDGVRRVSVRYDPEMGEGGTFLMRCDDCASRGESTAYWPLSLEFWLPNTLQRCRACTNARKRARHRMTAEERRAYNRKWYMLDHENRLAYARKYMAEHKDHVNSKRRARYAAKKAKERAAA